MQFDLVHLLDAAVKNAAILVPTVIALTTLYGRFGLSGKWQLLGSVATGFLLGVGAQVSAVGTPVDFAGWFALLLFGLIPGLVASGLYETGKQVVSKASG